MLIEVNNECNVRYDHAILKPERVHELIERVKARPRDGRRLLVGTSYGGGTVPARTWSARPTSCCCTATA